MQRVVSQTRKIVAVGRNYPAHAREMGESAGRAEPIIFLKPATSLLPSAFNKPIVLPSGADVHHEVELALVLGAGGRNVAPTAARRLVEAYSIAIDLTARNWQSSAKKKGEPWTLSKGCDTFTPIGDLIAPENLGDPAALDIWLRVNGELRQKGFTGHMTFDVDELLAYISRFMSLEAGDIVLTGTPAGVGPVRSGDQVSIGMSSSTGFQTEHHFSCVNDRDSGTTWTK